MTVYPSVPLALGPRHTARGAAFAVVAAVSIAACSSGTTGEPAAADEPPAASTTVASPVETPVDTTTPDTTAAPPSTTTADATTVAPGLVTAKSSLGGVPVTFTVPDGWDTDAGGAVVKGEPAFGVLFWGPFTRAYTDSCPSAMVDPPPGPTVDDFASVWADQPAFNATAPTDIVVDGFAGKLVEFTVPDYDEAECPYGDFMLLADDSGDGYWAQAPSGHHQLRILDVDGTRQMITSFWYPDTSAEDRAAIDEIIASIQIG
jgi:hypothetical protein